MINSGIYFGSVIYPEVLPYFDDYAKSLCGQSTDNFNLLLINDGIYREEDISYVRKVFQSMEGRYVIVEGGESYTPVQLRIQLMLEAKKRDAKILIIGDSDDFFAYNRIEAVIDIFSSNKAYTFVYNELRRFDGEKAMPDLPDVTNDINQILETNFLGLSNTAIKIDDLNEELILSFLECDSFVFDWYLYSRLLIEGYMGKLCRNTNTYYRIYDDNFAGLPENNGEAIKKEIAVKKTHYKMLSEYMPVFKEYYDAYCGQQIDFVINDSGKRFWWNYTKKKAR